MAEKREISNLHPVRIGKIKKLSSVKRWKTMYFVEIDWENGDFVKHFTSNPSELNQYVEGGQYIYQLEVTTILEDDREPETKTKIVFCNYFLPAKVSSMMKWADLIHRWIDSSAQQAIQSFTEISSFSESEFKERAGVIFDWKLEKLKNTEFHETFGADFDERLKNALEE